MTRGSIEPNKVPTDGDDRPAGGTNPLSGPVLVWATLGVVGIIVVAIVVIFTFKMAS